MPSIVVQWLPLTIGDVLDPETGSLCFFFLLALSRFKEELK
jgi:hypothetical protein